MSLNISFSGFQTNVSALKKVLNKERIIIKGPCHLFQYAHFENSKHYHVPSGISILFYLNKIVSFV